MDPASERGDPQTPAPGAASLRTPAAFPRLSWRFAASRTHPGLHSIALGFTPGMKILLSARERHWARNPTGEGELCREIRGWGGGGIAGGHPGARLPPLPQPGKNPGRLGGAALLGYFSLKDKKIPLRPLLPSLGEKMLHRTGGAAGLNPRGDWGHRRHLQLPRNPSGPRIKAVTSVN